MRGSQTSINWTVGGIVGATWGGWLAIDLVWVREDQRGAGLGSDLLHRIEAGGRHATGVGGLAWAVEDACRLEAVRRFGYTIDTVGNAPRSDFTRTLVMYRKGYQAEAARLAKDLRIKIVGPLDGLKPADMLGAHVALIVGS